MVCGGVWRCVVVCGGVCFLHTPSVSFLRPQANLKLQEARLAVAQAELAAAQEQLDAKQQELDQAQAMYDDAMREKQSLLVDAEACRRKMSNAMTLIDGLGGEKVSTAGGHVWDSVIQSEEVISLLVVTHCIHRQST